MIYTVTFNPSLDYIVSVEDFRMGMTNRTGTEQLLPGGKGINVSIMLKNLGVKSTALGFTAGFTGNEIIRRTEKMGLRTDFTRLGDGFSRINVKLKTIEGTEINGGGPRVGAEALGQLLSKLDMLTAEDILVLAGSIPSSVPGDIYRVIMERLEGRGVAIVLDATKDLLLGALGCHPFLIKPNNHELGEIFHAYLNDRDSVIPYAGKLQKMGARNVLVSLAGEGAVLVAEDGTVYETPAPRGRLVNGVGAGDSMVAGFIAGWLEQKNYRHAFYMAAAAGSASAFSEGMGAKEDVMKLYRQLKGC